MSENESMKVKKENRWFPIIKDIDTAEKTLKDNGWVGFIFAGMYLLGILFIVFFDKSVATLETISDEEKIYEIIGIAFLIIVVLFLSWRMRSKHGIISAIFLLGLFLFEIYSKIITGSANVGWILFYAVIVCGFVNSIRAIRYIKMHERLVKVRGNG